GIGANARNVLLFDTTDIASDVNEAGFNLTQRFYMRPTEKKTCKTDEDGDDEETAQDAQETQGMEETQSAQSERPANDCAAPMHEWATWEISQEYFIDPNFGGALIPGRRNVFDATLDLMAPAFLTSPRNIAPVVSRMRFEAIDNLRVQWDLDYDTIRGNIAANNL